MKTKSANAIGFNLLMINTFLYAASVYTPYLSAYYSQNGISAVKIGMLLTIGPVVSIFIQPLWALISDRTGRRKDVLSFVAAGSGLAIFSYYIGNTFLTFFIATILLTTFTTSIVPLSDAIIIKNSIKYQFDFAKIRMGGTLGFAISVILAGGFLTKKPSAQFLLGFIGYAILFFFTRRLSKEENEARSVSEVKVKQLDNPRERGILSIFHTKQIYFVLAFALISQVGLSFYNAFINVYTLELGYSGRTIGIINCIAALSEVPILFIINKLVKKVGPMKLIFISCILMSIRIFVITGNAIACIYFGQMFQGITYMTIYYSCAIFISENVKHEKQSQGQSTLTIIQAGIGSIIGNIVGGFMVDLFGLRSSYLIMSLIVLITAGLIAMVMAIYQRKMNFRMAKE
ncbi:MAG: ProP12 [Herbinix sp.]|jgi:oligosaccharide:H+ symporter|nr:ProP12 [Herbinix sp.]